MSKDVNILKQISPAGLDASFSLHCDLGFIAFVHGFSCVWQMICEVVDCDVVDWPRFLDYFQGPGRSVSLHDGCTCCLAPGHRFQSS